MNWQLFRQKIIESELGKDTVAQLAGWKNFKNLDRAIKYRKGLSIEKLEEICNIIEFHPATFLHFNPDHRKK